MSIDGFELLLQDFCAYCPDFEPEVEKIEYSAAFGKTINFCTNIRCQHRQKCARIAENLEGRLKSANL